MTTLKYFSQDTNTLLHNPEATATFADNFMILPITVMKSQAINQPGTCTHITLNKNESSPLPVTAADFL